MIHLYSIHPNMLMYNSIEIDGLPFWKMVTFHGYVTNKQMVS